MYSTGECKVLTYTSGIAFKPNPDYYRESSAFIFNGDISSVTFNFSEISSIGTLFGMKSGTITNLGNATSSSKTITNNSSYDYILGAMWTRGTDAGVATITVND